MDSWLTVEDGLVGYLPSAVFCVIIAAELWRPRRADSGQRGVRWLSNVGLFVINAALGYWLLPAAVGSVEPRGREADLLAWPAGLLFLDFLSYVSHRLFHAVPPLWRLHAVHHTDIDVDVTTAVRHHPVEFATIYVSAALVAGLVGVPAEVVAVYGAGLLALQMVQHGNISLSQGLDRRLSSLVVTPAFHRIHHSLASEDADTNFGSVLSVWDRLLGTMRRAPSTGGEPEHFGVAALSAPRYQRLGWMLLTPLL